MNQSLDYDLGYYYLVGDRSALSPLQLAGCTDDFRRGYRDREILRYAVDAYSFLIPRNTTYTASQFADAIRSYTTHPESKNVASVVERSTCTFEHKINGTITAYTESSNLA